MTEGLPALAQFESLVGTRLPDGAFTIDEEKHLSVLEVLHSQGYPHTPAHPIFGILALHAGMAWPFERLCEVMGSHPREGVLYGEVDLILLAPLQRGVKYVVRSQIDGITRKQGRRLGTFDVMTVDLELVDPEGMRTCLLKESYVFPRKAGL